MLDGQSQAVCGLVRGTGQVFGALTQDEGQLHNLVVNAGDTFDATSRQQEALAETFRIFPTFLDESKATFQRLESFSKDTDPLVQDLRPAARDLKPTLRDVRALAPDLRNLFVNLDPLITASKTGLPALRDTLTAGQAAARPAAAVPRAAQPGPAVARVQPADDVATSSPTARRRWPTPSRRSPATSVGHYLRQFGPIGPETVGMYPQRPAASRGNAYLAPDALSGAKRDKYMMFGNSDCKNAGGERMTRCPTRATPRRASCSTRPRGRRATRRPTRTSARPTTPSP